MPKRKNPTERQNLISSGKCKCPDCREIKDLSEFNKDKQAPQGVAIYCRKCNKDKIKRRYSPVSNRNSQLKSDFGITLDQYNQLLKLQDNCCAICKLPDSLNSLAVDHNHETNQIRGLLCRKCNLGLGLFKDSVELLDKARLYLQEESTKCLQK